MTASGTDAVKRAYSYVRFSSPLQARGDSARRQTAFAQDIARELGAVLDDSLALFDRGTSAFRGRNLSRCLGAFLDAVQGRRVLPGSILIIENLDRMSRQKPHEAKKVFEQLLEAGIVIATQQPRRVYTADSLNDLASILEFFITAQRAHEESQTKSVRVRAAWGQRKKRSAETGAPLTAMTPGWLELAPEGYRLVPERAAAVRAIFRMATDGLGSLRIVRELAAHPERYPPFGKSGHWNEEYVSKILASRAALGEHQLYATDPQTGRKAPQGEALKGFYPAVITEAEFCRARLAVKSRLRRSGRPAQGEENLFTGLVRSALTRNPMHLRSVTPQGRGRRRGRYSYLSDLDFKRGGRIGGEGPFSHSVPYPVFEGAVLATVLELSPADVLDRAADASALDDAIRDLTEELSGHDARQRLYAEKLRDKRVPAAAARLYADLIDEAAAAREQTALRLERLKAEALSGRPETLGEVRGLARIMGQATGEEGARLRRRLKSRLAALVESIWVLVEAVGYHDRVAHVRLYLRGGAQRYVRVDSPLGRAYGRALPVLDLAGVDLRALSAPELATLTAEAEINRGAQPTPCSARRRAHSAAHSA